MGQEGSAPLYFADIQRVYSPAYVLKGKLQFMTLWILFGTVIETLYSRNYWDLPM